jgi:hypothetical protein
MAIDLARVQARPSSRGVANLPPWNRAKEVRQRREFTFRLDFPRKRDLHKIAIASPGATELWPKPKRLMDASPEEMRMPRSPPQTKATPVHGHVGTGE